MNPAYEKSHALIAALALTAVAMAPAAALAVETPDAETLIVKATVAGRPVTVRFVSGLPGSP